MMKTPTALSIYKDRASTRFHLVYPFHYRGSDSEKFKRLVGESSGVEVRLRD